MSTYRQLWQDRWADHAKELEHLSQTANGLAGELEQLQAWCGELAGELRDLIERLLNRGPLPIPVYDRLCAVADQLEHESGSEGQAAGDIDTADYLVAELRKLEDQAGAWGEGYDHF